MKLILASSSQYRQQLLQKLGLPFECRSPDINETPHHEESPSDLVLRLALEKARAVAKTEKTALIIGSDQVAVSNQQILGKPGNFENAVTQLTQTSGKKVSFLTGLCLLNSSTGREQSSIESFNVYFRELSQTQIKRYLDAEKPFDCAGSFKSESLGITLFSKMEGDDPNTLIGLPLIRLVEMLQNEDVWVP